MKVISIISFSMRQQMSEKKLPYFYRVFNHGHVSVEIDIFI